MQNARSSNAVSGTGFLHFVFLLIICCGNKIIAQTPGIGMGTQTPHPSAALEISDTARGILIPRMTMAQRLAINNPADGLVVYQTDSNKGFWYWNGAFWIQVSTSVSFDNLNLSLRRLQTQHYLNH